MLVHSDKAFVWGFSNVITTHAKRNDSMYTVSGLALFVQSCYVCLKERGQSSQGAALPYTILHCYLNNMACWLGYHSFFPQCLRHRVLKKPE